MWKGEGKEKLCWRSRVILYVRLLGLSTRRCVAVGMGAVTHSGCPVWPPLPLRPQCGCHQVPVN